MNISFAQGPVAVGIPVSILQMDVFQTIAGAIDKIVYGGAPVLPCA
ncbi:hypothetical protein TRICHSKD4_3315 [Roseibium sp. TrichSKD4]|nr:hypothetical protein TRICHSKD4_3315 [Roseibium sp. TrichSKD4]